MTAWLHQQTNVPFNRVWALTEKLHKNHKMTIYTGNFGQNLPICSSNESGQVYQTFVRYPDHFVAFQNNLREKIVNDEEEIQKKNQILIDLREKASEIVQQEENVRLQQQAQVQAETERKLKMRTEMEQLLQERIRLDELQRLARLEHIKAIEDTIQTSLKH